MSSITRDLAKFTIDSKWEDLPRDIVHETKRVLMDSIGGAIGALSTEEGKMYNLLGKRYGGPPEASIVGTGDKVSLSTATLVNGELMFTLDYDSVMSNAHDADYIIPTILAFAESAGVSGKDFILASALGFEVSSRLALAVGQHPMAASLQPPPEGRRGLSGNAHSNFGAATGAGKVLKFNEEKMLHAMGIAGHLCMVMDKGRWGGGKHSFMHKYGVPGWQGTGAVTAVLLAEMGYIGDTTVLDDPERGFTSFTGYGQWHPEKILEDIGNTWWFMHRLHYRPYPCCGAYDTALDCLDDIINQHDIMPEEIESVTAYCGPSMYTENAVEEIQTTVAAAAFYAPFALSLVANRVKVGPEWYDRTTTKDPKIIKFMDKIICTGGHPDSMKYLAEDPLSSFSRCEVVARGKTFAVERKYRRGTIGTEAAPADDEIIEKFEHSVERILTRKKTEKAVDSFINLEKIDNISELISSITL